MTCGVDFDVKNDFVTCDPSTSSSGSLMDDLFLVRVRSPYLTTERVAGRNQVRNKTKNKAPLLKEGDDDTLINNAARALVSECKGL